MLEALADKRLHEEFYSWPLDALPSSLDPFEVIPIEVFPPFVSDREEFVLLVDNDEERAWVLVGGGIGGLLHCRGPMRVDEITAD